MMKELHWWVGLVMLAIVVYRVYNMKHFRSS